MPDIERMVENRQKPRTPEPATVPENSQKQEETRHILTDEDRNDTIEMQSVSMSTPSDGRMDTDRSYSEVVRGRTVTSNRDLHNEDKSINCMLIS